MPAAVPQRSAAMSRTAGLTRAGVRLPASRSRRRRMLRRTLVGSAIVHLLLLALFVLAPRAPPPETAPAEPGIAMEFETPKPKGAASDTPKPHAGQGVEAPTLSAVQSAPPATPSPPTPESAPLAPAPPAPDVPPTPAAPDTAPPDAQALQPPPVPPPPDLAPGETTPPDTDALPDAPPTEAPIAPVQPPAPAAQAPSTPQPPTVAQTPSVRPAGQPTPAPSPSPVLAPAPEAPESDVQVNAGPLAELFNLQPVPVPQQRPPPPPAPAPRPRTARPEPAFPTPRQWAFTPSAPLGGSPARGGSRGLNLSFAPQIHGGGGSESSPDFSAPDAGPDWLNELHAWWERHSYYPRGAREAGEQGTLRLHLVVNHDGFVTAARLTAQSGSVWLDQGTLSLFRDAHLPPLPPQTEKLEIPVDLTIRYTLR